MVVSVRLYVTLLIFVGVMRVAELALSGRNQAWLLRRGASQVREPDFCYMVATHVGILAGSAFEAIFLRRPFIPMLAAAMCGLFLAANAMRWWVIRTLRSYWTVRVMDVTKLGIVTDGPFRFIRHPNYAAVFFEMLALPLIHSAWISALFGSIVHIWALYRRLAVEEPVLMANKFYVETMAHKPRFLPGLF
jgi:methyltransferase